MSDKKKTVVYKKNASVKKKKTSSAREEGQRWASQRASEKVNRSKTNRKKHKAIRIMGIAACVAAVLVLVMVAVAALLIRHYYQISDYLPDDDVSFMDMADVESLEGDDDVHFRPVEETDENGQVIGTAYETFDIDDLSEDERASYESSIKDELDQIAEEQSSISEIPLATSGDVYNLLLIGVDLRAGENWNGNSDSMILISINSRTKTICMTSFMRDLYANIPGLGAYKLNRAHAVGGGPLLVQTIEENYRIDINNYARVNFYSLINIIDLLGGIDMDVSAEEATVANRYIREMCAGEGLDPNGYYLSGSGNMHLNGMQAVAYSRIRYVGNADFGRTERQRNVLAKIFTTLQTKSVTEVNAFLNAALPNVTHNITQDELTKLIMNAPAYLGYELKSLRVPLDGHYSFVGEMLMPDFEYTINVLRSTIY